MNYNHLFIDWIEQYIFNVRYFLLLNRFDIVNEK